MNKRLPSFLTWVMGFIALLLIIISLFIMTIQWVTFQRSHYIREYNRLGISENTGMNHEDLMAATETLLDYMKGKRDNIDIEADIHGDRRPVFNQREKDHMVDVRDLFDLSYKVKRTFIVVFLLLTGLAYFIKGSSIIKDYSLLYLLILGLLGLLGLIFIIFMLKDFTLLWDRFHHIFFKNDLWILDPKTDILIQMVPEEFFFNTITKILKIFLGIIAGFGVIATIVLIRLRKVKNLFI